MKQQQHLHKNELLLGVGNVNVQLAWVRVCNELDRRLMYRTSIALLAA